MSATILRAPTPAASRDIARGVNYLRHCCRGSDYDALQAARTQVDLCDDQPAVDYWSQVADALARCCRLAAA